MVKSSQSLPLPLVPIVLAGSPHLEHWPLSRIDRPIQFERARGHHSAFQRSLLQCQDLIGLNAKTPARLSDQDAPNRPIVCLAPALISEAYTQAQEAGVSFIPIIEPMERGGAPASLTAATVAEERFGPCLLLIMDVLALPQNKDDLITITSQAVASDVLQDHLLVCAERASHMVKHNGLTVQASGTVGHPRQFKIMQTPGEADRQTPTTLVQRPPNQERVQARHYALQDVILCTNGQWRQAINGLGNGCSSHIENALDARLDRGQDARAIWPNSTHYGLCEHTSLADVLERARDKILFRPLAMASVTGNQRLGVAAPTLAPSLTGEVNQSFALLDSIDCETTGSGHMIALVGCDGLKVVTTEDATLITNRDNTAPTDDLVAAMREREHPALRSKAEIQHAWGSERIVYEDKDHRICCITVLPGRSTDMQVHMRRDEFWYVLSGHGVARIDGNVTSCQPGATHAIAPRSPHGLTNTGEQPFIVLEARHGTYLGASDVYPAERDDLQQTELT
ncbi:MAG: cupin domain-containing protein [Pseudomonadota bacterium]